MPPQPGCPGSGNNRVKSLLRLLDRPHRRARANLAEAWNGTGWSVVKTTRP
jgi:hypothetical protein